MQFFEGDENFSWRVLAVESLVIMLSVLLGFTLNGWRQSVSEQENVDAALRSIAAEVLYNKRQLDYRLPHHREMLAIFDSLAVAKGGVAAVSPDTVQGWHFSIPPLTSSSYQAVVASQALSNMEFEIANSISEVYGLQEVYYDLLADKTLTALLNEELDNVGQIRNILENFVSIGQAVSKRYDRLLQTLAERGVETAQSARADSTHAEP